MQPIEVDVLLSEPIPYRVVWKDGTKETFLLPRLGTDDLIPWLDDLTKLRQEASRAAVAKLRLIGVDAARAEKAISLNDRAIVSDLSSEVQHPAGMRKVIAASLSKTGLPAEKQAAVLASMMAFTAISNYFSHRLSGLFYFAEDAEPARAALPAKEAPHNPLAVPGNETSATSASESITTG